MKIEVKEKVDDRTYVLLLKSMKLPFGLFY